MTIALKSGYSEQYHPYAQLILNNELYTNIGIFQKIIKDRIPFYWSLLFKNNEIIGHALSFEKRENNIADYDLRNDIIGLLGCYVKPEYRCQGYATKLLHDIKKIIDQKEKPDYKIAMSDNLIRIGEKVFQEHATRRWSYMRFDDPTEIKRWKTPPILKEKQKRFWRRLEKNTEFFTQDTCPQVIKEKFKILYSPILQPLEYNRLFLPTQCIYKTVNNDGLIQMTPTSTWNCGGDIERSLESKTKVGLITINGIIEKNHIIEFLEQIYRSTKDNEIYALTTPNILNILKNEKIPFPLIAQFKKDRTLKIFPNQKE